MIKPLMLEKKKRNIVPSFFLKKKERSRRVSVVITVH